MAFDINCPIPLTELHYKDMGIAISALLKVTEALNAPS
jgi:hypothetical protein